MNGRKRRLLWLFAVAVTLAACATMGVKLRRMKLAEQLNFSHKKHFDEDNDCSDCHKKVASSEGPTLGKFIPSKHTGCKDCHDEVDEKEGCRLCHITKERDIELTRVNRHLRFSHRAHMKRVKQKCKSCHPGAYTAKVPGIPLVPSMERCAESCHKKEVNELRCDMCHTDLQTKRLKPIAQFSHENNYLKRHGMLARNAEKCAMCHDQTFCSDCHARSPALSPSIRFPEQINASFIHRGDFIGRHAVEARAEPMTCQKCHGPQFCSSCHQLQGLTITSPVQQQGTTSRRAHSADFMRPGTAGFHGRLARENISTCANCHDQGSSSNCVTCHKVGASGGTPHPRDFKWSNKANECLNNSMCATCHTAGTGCR